MGNNWAIIDNNGIIHSGTEQEMATAWDIMNRDIYSVSEEDEVKHSQYLTTWEGDLMLIQIHNVTK